MTDINDAFDDESNDIVEPETVDKSVTTTEETAVQESAVESKDDVEQKSLVSEGEAKEEDKTESKEDKSVPLNALLAERKRRQEVETRLEQLRQANQPKVEAPNPTDDPEGYKEFVKQQVEAENLNERINRSQQVMLGEKVDYEEKINVYKFLASTNPDLEQQLRMHPDPARFAYETAVKHDSDARSKMRDEIEKEILASAKGDVVKKDVAEERKLQAVNAPDLTGATAIGKNSEGLVVDNPSDVKEIFKDSPF